MVELIGRVDDQRKIIGQLLNVDGQHVAFFHSLQLLVFQMNIPRNPFFGIRVEVLEVNLELAEAQIVDEQFFLENVQVSLEGVTKRVLEVPHVRGEGLDLDLSEIFGNFQRKVRRREVSVRV